MAMSEHRTRQQREANELDLQMYRMAEALVVFGESLPRASERYKFLDVARSLMTTRYIVQTHMHPKDLSEIKA